MKKTLSFLHSFLMTAGLAASLSACTSHNQNTVPDSQKDSLHQVSTPSQTETAVSPTATMSSETAQENTMKNTQTKLNIEVNGQTFAASLENNEAAEAFEAMLPLTLSLSDYAGFEKVGPLGATLPASDVHTTTHAGDIVLYNSNQIVVFYGSNSWSYTRLAHVDDLDGWTRALGHGDVSVTFTAQQ